MRLFIALSLAKEEKDYIYNKINSYKDKISEKLKWVEKENLHITLKYIGDLDKYKISELIQYIVFVSHTIEQQCFDLGSIAALPHIDYPRIVYLSVKDLNNNLSFIHQNLEEKLSGLGIKKDKKKYIPHITLARCKRKTNMKKLSLEIKYLTDKINFNNNKIKLNKISLYNSILHKEGPVYEELYNFTFK
ncbi:RNA 2',3'-cyclic phosphodiesterase [Natronospora cellulosivora (SeqCode)]